MHQRRQMTQMNVHECPRCGSSLRYGGDVHECDPRDDSRVRFNLATADEEKALETLALLTDPPVAGRPVKLTP